MIVTVTGHRPNKLIGGWDWYSNKTGTVNGLTAFIPFLTKYFLGLGVTRINTGCAVGFDTIAAIAAYKGNIPYDAYVPFEGHHKKWNQLDQDRFTNRVLRYAKNIFIPEIEPKEYWEVCKALNQRNIDMLDANPDCVIALWNNSSGGTGNAVKEAVNRKIPVLNVWDEYSLIVSKIYGFSNTHP